MTLRSKYHSFTQLPVAVRWRIPVTWCLLGLSRLLVLVLPFRMLAPRLGQRAAAPVVLLVQTSQLKQLSLLKQLIAVTSKYCPWRANCFAQAITASYWLRRWGIPYSVFFGVARDPMQRLKAHAWVMAGPVAVSGGYGFSHFTVVGSYVSDINAVSGSCCKV